MKRIFTALFLFTATFFSSYAEKKIDFITAFEPTLIINTEDSRKSAPSPVVYPICFGIVVPNKSHISFQPRLSFFTNYYLYADNMALPAEIENRTATVFSFLVDLPVSFSFTPGQKHCLELGGGPSTLLRFAVLSNGVQSSDAGSTGSASGDVDEINSWFWKNANFLYLEGFASYLFKFSDLIKAGPELKLYMPFGSIFSGNGLNAMMIGIGIKARF